MSDLTIKDAQTKQPWTVPYSEGVKAASQCYVPHILASHNVLHAAKSVGKLAAVFESMDHCNRTRPTLVQLDTIQDMAADLLTEALRFANLYGFDLESALRRRVLEKNGVEL